MNARWVVESTTNTRIAVMRISVTTIAPNENPPGERSPHPLTAKFVGDGSKSPGAPAAMIQITSPPSAAPASWATTYTGTSAAAIFPFSHKPTVTAGLM